ncbi:histidine triad nucleotide-binding protein [Paenibacillus aceris]|uniref:Histidine triad (HIT) family protein n=1 Tax=Paenibacillus aceris TaxID=869555 RepID=A0ABS4HS69_9BACL|nr:histidine triad nucleotide-binding protein [Paenibacillus aceris]MBP1961465.1 histidine triad (HIT) family protein [Paenibacillus aceris]NHW37756.1 histidine triad nucleotide-binding protein [Paenibacillus aceris]
MSDCIFCKIVAGELPSKKVYEDGEILAFHDIQPASPIHVLIIPKKHIASLADAKAEDWPLMGQMQAAAAQIARELDVEESGYRVITNIGANAGQIVHHIHYHLMAGARLSPLGVHN